MSRDNLYIRHKLLQAFDPSLSFQNDILPFKTKVSQQFTANICTPNIIINKSSYLNQPQNEVQQWDLATFISSNNSNTRQTTRRNKRRYLKIVSNPHQDTISRTEMKSLNSSRVSLKRSHSHLKRQSSIIQISRNAISSKTIKQAQNITGNRPLSCLSDANHAQPKQKEYIGTSKNSTNILQQTTKKISTIANKQNIPSEKISLKSQSFKQHSKRNQQELSHMYHDNKVPIYDKRMLIQYNQNRQHNFINCMPYQPMQQIKSTIQCHAQNDTKFMISKPAHQLAYISYDNLPSFRTIIKRQITPQKQTCKTHYKQLTSGCSIINQQINSDRTVVENIQKELIILLKHNDKLLQQFYPMADLMKKQQLFITNTIDQKRDIIDRIQRQKSLHRKDSQQKIGVIKKNRINIS